MNCTVLSSRLLSEDERKRLAFVLHNGWMQAGDREVLRRLLMMITAVDPGEAIRIQRVQRPHDPEDGIVCPICGGVGAGEHKWNCSLNQP